MVVKDISNYLQIGGSYRLALSILTRTLWTLFSYNTGLIVDADEDGDTILGYLFFGLVVIH